MRYCHARERKPCAKLSLERLPESLPWYELTTTTPFSKESYQFIGGNILRTRDEQITISSADNLI